MWAALFFPFLKSAIKLNTETELLGWLEELVGLIRDGLTPLEGGVDGLNRDGLTPLELEEDSTDVLLGEGGRDPVPDKDRDLTPAIANLVLSDGVAETDLRALNNWKLSSTDFTSLPILPLSASNNSLAASVESFCKGLLASPGKDNLLSEGTPIPETEFSPGNDNLLSEDAPVPETEVFNLLIVVSA